jgi:tetratricopeptide (TPR) repeat protein
MTRHPTARRVHRRSTGTDDAFVAQVVETSFWAREHARVLLIGGIVTAIVVLFALWYVSSRRSLAERASAELTPIRALVQAGNAQAAVPQLEQYLTRFGATPTADEARLMLGEAYLVGNQTPKAAEVLEEIDEDFDNPMSVNALLLRAAALESSQQAHRAEELYLRIGGEAPFSYQRRDALDNAARIRMASNNPAGAAELYRRILDAMPETDPARGVFELRLGEAEATAASVRMAGNRAGPAAGTAPSPSPAPADSVTPPPAASSSRP